MARERMTAEQVERFAVAGSRRRARANKQGRLHGAPSGVVKSMAKGVGGAERCTRIAAPSVKVRQAASANRLRTNRDISLS
jgi:hypothetical protein